MRRKKAIWAAVLGVCLLGALAYAYAAGSARRSLRRAASRTTKLVVEVQGVEGNTVKTVRTIEVSSEEDVAAFFGVLRLENNRVFSYWHCACLGNPHICLHDADGPFAKISIHHGKSIRCDLWPGNVNIRKDMIPKVEQYFESRGVKLE
jgi:hypothetical protein